jgi:glycosyltransferase involved in cell wall biosynthesis
MVSKALVAGIQQRKLEELAALPQVSELYAVVPPYWEEPRVGRTALDKRYTRGYTLAVETMALNGHHHTHFYPGLARHIRRFRPDVVHADDESFNLTTFQAIRLAKSVKAASVFYNYANIYRNYPPPFSLFEKYNFRAAGAALACNVEAQEILRRRGFNKSIEICPQFGVDLTLTHRQEPPTGFKRPGVFTLGYFGRLVPEKGVNYLLDACARLKGDWRLVLIGQGAEEASLKAQAEQLNITDKVEFRPFVPSTEVAAYMSGLDVFVLPSITFPNWKEQFGRVLIESMACEVPVIGSESGEIPHVIGDAGLTFPEKDVNQLTVHLQKLYDNPTLCTELAAKGLARVQEKYTQKQIALKHVEVYQMALDRSLRLVASKD